MAQSVRFLVGGEEITVASTDAGRLVDALRSRPDAEAKTAADRIEQTAQGTEPNTIELSSTEGDEVLAVLAQFEETVGLDDALARLARALETTIEREPQ